MQWSALRIYEAGQQDKAIKSNSDKCEFDEILEMLYVAWPSLRSPVISETWRTSAVWVLISKAKDRIKELQTENIAVTAEQLMASKKKRTWATYDEAGNTVKQDRKSKKSKQDLPLFKSGSLRFAMAEEAGKPKMSYAIVLLQDVIKGAEDGVIEVWRGPWRRPWLLVEGLSIKSRSRRRILLLQGARSRDQRQCLLSCW